MLFGGSNWKVPNVCCLYLNKGTQIKLLLSATVKNSKQIHKKFGLVLYVDKAKYRRGNHSFTSVI